MNRIIEKYDIKNLSVNALKKSERIEQDEYFKKIDSNRWEIFLYIKATGWLDNLNFNAFLYLFDIVDKYTLNETMSDKNDINEIDSLDIKIFHNLLLNPYDSLLDVLKQLSDIELETLIKRSKKMTLESIAIQKGLTRERIRQIESGALKKVSNSIKHIISFNVLEKGYVNIANIYSELERIPTPLIKFLLESNKKVIYNTNLDKYLIDQKTDKEINKTLNTLTSSDIIYYDEIKELIEKYAELNINFIDELDIISLLLNKEYLEVEKDFISPKKIAIPYLYIIKKHFKDGINLNQINKTEDFIKLEQLVETHFDIRANTKSVRSIYARIRPELTKIDRSNYIYNVQNNLDPSLQELIKNIFSDKTKVYYFNEVYKKHQKALKEEKILNHYQLADVVNQTELSQYSSRDKVLFSNVKHKSLSDMLREFILLKQTRTLSEIRKQFKNYNDSFISQTLYMNSKIKNWGHGRYIHVDNIPTIENFKQEKLKTEIEKRNFLSFVDFSLILNNNVNLLKYDIVHNHDVKYILENSLNGEYFYSEGVIWHKKMLNKKAIERIYLIQDAELTDEINIDNIRKTLSTYQVPYNTQRSVLKVIDNTLLRKNEKNYYGNINLINCEEISSIEHSITNLLKYKRYTTVYEVIDNMFLQLEKIYLSKESIISIIKNQLSQTFNFFPIGEDKLLTTYGLITTKNNKDIVYTLFEFFKDNGIEVISEEDLERYILNNNISKIGIPNEFYKNKKYPYKKGEFNLKG